jgi:hypothetical protein
MTPDENARAQAVVDAMQKAVKDIFNVAQANEVPPCNVCSTLVEKLVDTMIQMGHAGCVASLVIDILQSLTEAGEVLDLSPGSKQQRH